MTVSARTHAHCPLRRKERELVRLRRFSFLRDLIDFWLWLTPLAWLVAAVEYAWAAGRRGATGPAGGGADALTSGQCPSVMTRHSSSPTPPHPEWCPPLPGLSSTGNCSDPAPAIAEIAG